MNVSLWAYPWDIHDLGARLPERMAAAGADMISLAMSYHAGRFLQPGNPRRRVYFPQDGTVYYRPDPAHWQGCEIQPLEADIVAAEGDQMAALQAQGVKVSAWTVLLHNTRLGMAHPDHCLRTAHGDPVCYGLCPSSPAVRDYAVRLVAEIAARGPARIEIESPDFMGFSHGFHHEKDGLPVLPEDDFLLGLCFCRHCLARAALAGVDAKAAQAQVAGLLDAAFARDLPQAQVKGFPDQGIAAFAAFPALHAFLQWRTEPVTSLLAEIRAATDVPLLLIDYEGSWWGGVDPAACAHHVDGFLYCAYRTPAARIAALLKQARADLGPGKTLVTGFLLFHPEVKGPEDLAQRVKAAEPWSDGFSFYNLGLLPPKRLAWIAAALG